MDILGFRAPRLVAAPLVALPPLAEKSAALPDRGRVRIGAVRPLDKAAAIAEWQPVDGGYVARVRVSSEGAAGIRAKLALGTVPGPIDVRVRGNDDRVEGTTIEPFEANGAWTPWTNGPEQLIELFSRVQPSADAVSVESVVHFTDSPVQPKLAAACTVSTECSTGDATIDAAMAERKNSVVKMVFTDAGSAFLCSGTLINTERFPAGYLLTANHCIDTAESAASLTTYWFYEAASCSTGGLAGGGVNPSFQQISGGATLVFTNYNADSTLLLMNRAPASGAVYSAWNRAMIPSGTPIVSLSHPSGDTMRVALGNITQQYRIEGRPQDEYGVRYTLGIIQGGSSGSGLFTLNGSSLELRGILTGTTVRQPGGLSCGDTVDEGLYGRFDIFEPQIDQYIRLAAQAPDDAPNRAQDWFTVGVTDPNGLDKPLDQRSSPLVLSRRIDYVGDVDVYRFILGTTSTVSIYTTGTMDTVGSILDNRGTNIEANDDGDGNAQGDYNFKITRQLAPGTYYVQVAPWDPQVTGPYTLNMTTTSTSTGAIDGRDYTGIWWNSAESGWGVSFNHQGSIVVAALYTYDTDGTPMWLTAANTKQADGSYTGDLYRATGAPFNAPWSPNTNTKVGTMTLAFSSSSAATLTYVYNGFTVTKSITRLDLTSAGTTCTFTTSDRSTATNYQDLWWNPNESGWGVNVTQSGDTMFAALYTYDLNGRGTWFTMNASRVGAGNVFSGPLYTTTGAPFNQPWHAGPPPTQVGTMTFTFTSGNAGTMTYNVNGISVAKSIQRLIFANPTSVCQ